MKGPVCLESRPCFRFVPKQVRHQGPAPVRGKIEESVTVDRASDPYVVKGGIGAAIICQSIAHVMSAARFLR